MNKNKESTRDKSCAWSNDRLEEKELLSPLRNKQLDDNLR